MARYKLSASALSSYLKSPKGFWWRYRAKLEPIQQAVANFDHDKLAGVLWSSFVDRFYNGAGEKENADTLLAEWTDKTDGWVPEKARDRLTKSFETLMPSYYQMFNPGDGTRGKGKSELFIENDRFQGYLDGLSDDGVVHEVKMTSRSPSLMGQLWKVENSIQVKLYCVLTKATGRQIEFAWKDTPHAVFRGPVSAVTPEQLRRWEAELNTLADEIYTLGDDSDHFPCNPDGCCLVTKGVTSMCGYHTLCDMGYNDFTKVAYKEKTRR